MSSVPRKRYLAFRTRITLAAAVVFLLLSTLTFGALYAALRARLVADLDARLLTDLASLQHLAAVRKARIIQSTLDMEARFRGPADVFYRVLDTNGALLAMSDTNAWAGVADQPPPRSDPGHASFATLTRLTDGAAVRVAYSRDESGRLFQHAQTLHAIEAISRSVRRLAIAGLLINLCAGIGVINALAGRAMSRVARVRRTAETVSQTSLFQRVPVTHRGDEIDALAESFNAMLTRVEATVVDLQHVGDEIAHDLRNAVSRTRLAAETALRTDPPDEAADRAALADVIEGCDHMRGVIDDILQLARMESGALPLQKSALDLALLWRTAADLYADAAREAGLRITMALPAASLSVPGDRAALQRLAGNLLDNALKYTPAGGEVHIEAEQLATAVRVHVRNSGPGIPAEDLPHLFERFYRGRRTRGAPGVGLGLPMARRIALLHGGELTVQSQPGHGSTFTLQLPR
ncbi:MAG: HAMP domain-containing protein [Lentisphaerae bacterium]|nr:HAMP domain-containing protein [Lentisphaerota bacterium]